MDKVKEYGKLLTFVEAHGLEVEEEFR